MNTSVPISLSCNFSSCCYLAWLLLEAVSAGFGYNQHCNIGNMKGNPSRMEIWKEVHLGCFCILLGTEWESFGTIAAVWDLERAVLRLLKSVLEIQLVKGLPMEKLFSLLAKKQWYRWKHKPAAERNRSLKMILIQENILFIFLRFSPCKSWGSVQVLVHQCHLRCLGIPDEAARELHPFGCRSAETREM